MTELWIYSTPKPNVSDNGFIGFACPGGYHYRALTEWEIENRHAVKSECRCPVCGETMVPCSGVIRDGKLEPWE